MSKKEEAPPKLLLGRPSNSLQVGVVGLPNVGKSTLFNILTKMSVPAENYPFCTIEPNLSRVAVPDERFDWLCEHFKPASVVPAQLQITDIAGLIRGAHKGEGLGNAFLSHIRAVDGIFHVVRIFEDDDVTHVDGSVDPVRDLETISEELLLKDIETVTKELEKLEKVVHREKHRKPEYEAVKKVDDWVRVQKKQVRFGDWKATEIEHLNNLQLLTAKPVVYLINMSESDYIKKKNKWLIKIKQWVDEHSKEAPEVIIPFCGVLEAKLVELGPEKAAEYLKQIGTTTAIPKIIKTGYHAINLVHFFTSGTDEVKCWTVRKYTKAPDAAGVIHSDMKNGFICAEVMKYVDYRELGSEAACRAGGKHRQEGKNYTVEDGDIVFFKFNPAGGGGKKEKK
jgi:obg-like ATPase 1